MHLLKAILIYICFTLQESIVLALYFNDYEFAAVTFGGLI